MTTLSWIRTTVQLVGMVAFGIVTIQAKPLLMHRTVAPATEASCCITMMPDAVACPIGSGMNGNSCCNMQSCLQLFFQTGQLRLDPGATDLKWENFNSRAVTRSERPPVPPPRA